MFPEKAKFCFKGLHTSVLAGVLGLGCYAVLEDTFSRQDKGIRNAGL